MPENPTPATDLTKRPPRSARTRLGGYALFARMLDKGRAQIAGTNGDYKFGCPLDQQFLQFVGVSAEDIRKLLEEGKGDNEILEWVQANAKKKRETWEILAWTNWQNDRVPTDVEMRDFFQDLHKTTAPQRGDIATWADLLDVDDYVSFGGKA